MPPTVLPVPTVPAAIQPPDPIQRHDVPHFIADDNDSIPNVFCFGAFADNREGVVYNDLAGAFPFISPDGNVCFFAMYHYKANVILVTPVVDLDNNSIFNAYKMQFNNLASKGFKPTINIMDNQATKHIQAFLTEKECTLQLVEPHNHQVNAV